MNASVRTTSRRVIVSATLVGALLFAIPVFSAVISTATIPTGESPSALAINPVSHRVYSADYFGDSVSVLDGAADLRLATLPVGLELQVPNAIVVNPLTTPARAYSANFWTGTLSVIDESSTALSATVAVSKSHGSGAPRALAIDPSGTVQKLYVAEYGANCVSVWNAETYELIKRIPVGWGPRGLGIFSSVSRKRVYVLNKTSNSVSVIDGDTDTVVSTVGVGVAPKAVAIDTSTGRAWVTNEKSNTVTVIGTDDKVAATITVGARPIGIAIDPPNSRVFVANTGAHTVSVIRSDTLTNEATLPVGQGPWAIAVDPATSRALVTCFTADSVAVIDPALSVRSVPVGDGPYALAIDDSVSPSKVFVTNRNGNSVSVLRDDGFVFGALSQNALAYAASAPVASIGSISVTKDAATGEQIIEGTATSTRAFPAGVLSLRLELDGSGIWREAAIVEGRGTAVARWGLRVPALSAGTHTMRVKVLDQTSAASASSEGASADKSVAIAVAVAPSFEVGPSLLPKKGAACTRCHGTSSRGRRPNAPVGVTRCPAIKTKVKSK